MSSSKLKILMVSTEYPPMRGGVGRYTYNLVNALKNNNVSVKVVSGDNGDGDYRGISPFNKHNSKILLDKLDQVNPDIVHIQLEHGLYGFKLPFFPIKIKFSLDEFYDKCKIPIVTTFHSSYDFKQWLNLIKCKSGKSKTSIFDTDLKLLYQKWLHIINYYTFYNLNIKIMKKSSSGIVFSRYLSTLIPGSEIIYHGSEPFNSNYFDKLEARKKLGLPIDSRIAVVVGFLTATKGLDIIKKMDIPKNWIIVTNFSKNHYNKETINLDFSENKKIINLNMGYVSEKELSLLFFASDVVLQPYTVSSGSGVMFDALGHGLPFVSTNLGFFKEFEDKNLGVCVKRDPYEFSMGLKKIEEKYDLYFQSVKKFKENLRWDIHAKLHIKIYERNVKDNKLLIKINSSQKSKSQL